MNDDPAAPTAATRVLIVDDERSIRVTLSAFLSEAGYDVSVAEDATQAINMLAERAFDLVVTDIIMPRLGGVELLKHIHDHHADTLVLLMTGEPTVETAAEAVRAGAYDYLTKPVSKHDILQHVARASSVRQLMVDKRRLEDANRRHQVELEDLVAARTSALREREEQLSSALIAARAVVWDADLLSGTVIEVGPVEAVFGLAPGARHADLAALQANLHPDDRPLVAEWIEQAGRGDGRFEAKFRAVAEDGSIRWVAASGHVSRDDDGRPARLHGIARDITERHQLQASLAQADRLASMGMLAAGVAHEINNPLTYVLYHLETLIGELPTEAPGAHGALHRVEEAFHGASRIQEISRALGAFSRVEESQPAPVQMGVAIEHACRMAQNEVKYRARLQTDVPAGLPEVLATEGKLAQVFLNLLVNAAHAMDQSSAEANVIQVRAYATSDRVCAEVRDTGSGIRPEHLARIFEPFFTTKPVGVGSGLGLAISRSILEGFGGGISVTSELGVGTCFALWLPPMAPGAGGAGEAGPPSALAKAPAGRILVVDDDASVRQALCEMLSAAQVEAADSGAAARQLLAAGHTYDAILCDVMMPGMSGIELHRWMRNHAHQQADRVVFITGGAFAPGASQYLDSVPNPRLDKPFVVDRVRAVVAQLVEQSSGDGPDI